MPCMTEPPTLPFEPESIEHAWTRYPASVARIYTYAEMISACPQRDRKHTFDFADGLRLVVSREVIGDMICVHFSASAAEHSDIFRDVQKMSTLGLDTFYARIVARFQAISNDQRPARFIALAAGGIPHWIIPE